MTIRMHGHIESLAIHLPGKVALTIIVERERMAADTMTIFATTGEAEVYRPGTAVEIAVTPR